MQDDFEFFEHPILNDQQMADLKIKPGEYPMEVFEAKSMVASTGNKMLMLKMKVFDDNGRTHTMTDFLVAVETMAYKIKHFWESVGFPDRYNHKNKSTDYTGRKGYVSVKPQKNKHGLLENKIVDYILNKETKENVATANENLTNSSLEDDLPF